MKCAFFFGVLAQVAVCEEVMTWTPYETEIFIPKVIDLRKGGSVDMVMAQHDHYWGGGFEKTVPMYGYSAQGSDVTFPGPTILVSKNVPVSINWINNIPAPHILDAYIARELMVAPAACYPLCGVPLITHVHGMEVPASSDGLPYQAIYEDEFRTHTYNNSQMPSTHIYHDHAMGLTRLNAWAGLVGTYIIDDPDSPAQQAMETTCDVLLILTDTIIDTNGTLLYATPPEDCHVDTKWAPESFGTVNAVNGIVMPFVQVPNQQCRLRIANGANSRMYNLNLPFFEHCQVIATDMGYVNTPYKLTSAEEISVYNLERVELMCDFREVPVDTKFDVTVVNYVEGTEQVYDELFQVRVTAAADDADGDFTVPQVLNTMKSMKELYESSPVRGLTRNITLEEVVNENDCPTQLLIKENGVTTSFLDYQHIECIKGTVEKWNFVNPTADYHPFHWHAISVQCGPTEDTVNTNELKDTVPIPNETDDYDTITQVCFVACTPNEYLEEGSTIAPDAFAFSTALPYVFHCHILEHEENMMMTYFVLADAADAKNN
jgi:FtsP/CotA-like multicopper oxidase with cupredoxin domain